MELEIIFDSVVNGAICLGVENIQINDYLRKKIIIHDREQVLRMQKLKIKQ